MASVTFTPRVAAFNYTPPRVLNPSSYISNDDLQTRATIAFGVFGTFFALVGIIVSGLTLRVMYQAHGQTRDLESNILSEIQMQPVEIQHSITYNGGRVLTDDTLVGERTSSSVVHDRYTRNAEEEGDPRRELPAGLQKGTKPSGDERR